MREVSQTGNDLILALVWHRQGAGTRAANESRIYGRHLRSGGRAGWGADMDALARPFIHNLWTAVSVYHRQFNRGDITPVGNIEVSNI